MFDIGKKQKIILIVFVCAVFSNEKAISGFVLDKNGHIFVPQ
jgi:hypothetical protein